MITSTLGKTETIRVVPRGRRIKGARVPTLDECIHITLAVAQHAGAQVTIKVKYPKARK